MAKAGNPVSEKTSTSPTAALTVVRCLAQEKGRPRLAVVEMIQEWRKELEDLHGHASLTASPAPNHVVERFHT
jgi:hypothetical protein